MLQTRRLTEDDGIELIDDTVQQRLRVRVRRAVVAFLSDMLDGARSDHGAGMMAFNPLLAYGQNTVGGRLKAVITGIGNGQPWGDVDALLSDLTGRIALDQLSAGVQAEIAKISSAVTDVGSVNQRLQQETNARVTAITDEATARAAAITSAVNSLTTILLADINAGDSTLGSRITTEVANLVQADSALGVRIDTVSARLNSGDIASALSEARSYAYTKAASDAATAAAVNTLRSEFTQGDATVNSRVSQEVLTLSTANTALGQRIDNVSARLNTGDIAVSLAQAATYAYTKAQADNAIAVATSAISARLNAGGDIATSLATANSYAYTKAQTDSAISSSQTTLRSEFNPINARLNAGGDIYASLATANSYAYTKAQTDSAISSSQTTLRSEFNPINARLNAGGDIYASLATANSYAYTKAQADAAISASASTISARLNAGGDIANSLATANSYAYTKAASDAAMAATVSTLRAEYGPYSGSISTLQQAVGGANGLQSQYALKVVAQRGDGRPVFGMIGLAATAPNSGTGASQIILSADSLMFVPSDSANAAPVGFLEVGVVNGVTTLRVPAARIGDATITPGKLSVPYLSAVASDLGTVNIGVGGYLRSGKAGFGDTTAGFWIANTGGDPQLHVGNNAAWLKFSSSTGLDVRLPSFSASIPGGDIFIYVGNGGRSYGSRTVSVAGGIAPYSYRWTVTEVFSGNTTNAYGAEVNTGATTATANFTGYATDNILTIYVTCTVRDGNGRATEASFMISATHGLPP
ncbi:hypothetical protein ACFP3P_10555 [Pelomonas aquatica]